MNNTSPNPSVICSVVIPARNESEGLRKLLPELRKHLPPDSQIVVVDDGSNDETSGVCMQHSVQTIRHPYPKGNGAAIKSGARAATGDILIFMDADGQHQPQDIPLLLKKFDEGYDMVIGARTFASQAGTHRALANGIYNKLASWMIGQPIRDLTSGFRLVKADLFRKFLYLLPNGFSYPTTITMSFFRAGYSVGYVPIVAARRVGKSHVRLLRDGLRFLLIIFKIGSLYSPLKLFLPISLAFFFTGVSYHIYTYLTLHRFTNMSALLYITSVLIFLIGLVSEQITSLFYKEQDQ